MRSASDASFGSSVNHTEAGAYLELYLGVVCMLPARFIHFSLILGIHCFGPLVFESSAQGMPARSLLNWGNRAALFKNSMCANGKVQLY
jgi:hypothetical protein